jgi:pimeloyl-ACP methyl ester carboxylesterase
MSIFSTLEQKIIDASKDAELTRLAPGLDVTIKVVVGESERSFGFLNGLLIEGILSREVISIVADEASWEKVLAKPPAPTYHSFTALQIANPHFEVLGEARLIAQARPLLERVFEIITQSPIEPAPTCQRSLKQVSGHYAEMSVGAECYEVYYETAGEGTPILFLHTAGADSRQYFDQLTDPEIASRFRMYALDLPFHGKSMPSRGWDGSNYLLTAKRYQNWCVAFIRQVIGERAIVVGGSMGAAMSLVLAAESPADLIGIVALEPPFQSRGRRNIYQNHVEVHGGLHNGSYVRGIMSPTSPIDNRRRASWIYSQGGPGIYPGDLAFYSDEFNGAVTAPKIDAEVTPVALLSGTYDYSATPEHGAQLAALIPGSLHLVMPGLGHFPMIEHPNLFNPFLMQGLAHVVNRHRV